MLYTCTLTVSRPDVSEGSTWPFVVDVSVNDDVIAEARDSRTSVEDRVRAYARAHAEADLKLIVHTITLERRDVVPVVAAPMCKTCGHPAHAHHPTADGDFRACFVIACACERFMLRDDWDDA